MNEHENCHVEPLEKLTDRAALATATAAYLAIEGMGCSRCAVRVRNGLLYLDGVLLVNVFLEDGAAAVAFDPVRVMPADLVRAVAAAGGNDQHDYRAQVMSLIPAVKAPELWPE